MPVTLRLHGFSDRAIRDAAQVIAYFNVAGALGVNLEDWMLK